MSEDDMADMVSRALRKAWFLGQTYWAQADSERESEWNKADATSAAMDKLVDETRAAILAKESA